MKELGKARGLVAIGAIAILAAACGGGTATSAPTTAPSTAPSTAASEPPASEPASAPASEAASQAAKQYTIGFSNTGGTGNGFREEQNCTALAEALASGQVSSVNMIAHNTDPAGQLADLRTLISAGVDAIVFNPSSPDALNPALAEAKAAGIKTVAVDAYVTDPDTWNFYNNQEEYAYLGAKWLFDKIGNTGTVWYTRGIAGHPADTDRDKGFKRALAENPNIKVLPNADGVFTDWDQAKATQLANEFISSGQYDTVQGIWTSGMDSPVVDAVKQAGKKYVPIVGADLGAFANYLLDTASYPGLEGAAVTNTAAVGGAGVAVALKLLNGETLTSDPASPRPNTILLKPVLADNTSDAGKATLQSWKQVEGLNPIWPLSVTIPEWTHYTPEQAVACKGPGQ
jgi:ribose transport system substrate-binding protein